MLSELGSAAEVGGAEGREPERHARVQGWCNVVVLYLDEQASDLQVRVIQQIVQWG
ncbi:MAG TPA: hypothetical protein VLL25_10155 [Acidimicrobiales bacterium]|nr:hypothetical protein [Acidimicrobiales bacterium]